MRLVPGPVVRCAPENRLARGELAQNLTSKERALPGSTVVGRALDVSDASRARADSLNAQVDALPR